MPAGSASFARVRHHLASPSCAPMTQSTSQLVRLHLQACLRMLWQVASAFIAPTAAPVLPIARLEGEEPSASVGGGIHSLSRQRGGQRGPAHVRAASVARMCTACSFFVTFLPSRIIRVVYILLWLGTNIYNNSYRVTDTYVSRNTEYHIVFLRALSCYDSI